MMLRSLVLLVALALAWPAVGTAGEADASPSVIVVSASGSARQPPDDGTFTYTVRGEGKTEVQALSTMSDARGHVEQGLAALAGASHVDIDASNLGVTPARGEGCRDRDPDEANRSLATGPCAIIGYVATMDVTVTVEPPARLGDAISLASELGATGAAFGKWELHDEASLNAAAVRDAMASARRQAEIVATASGAKLGHIVRIEDQSSGPTSVNELVTEDRANFAGPPAAPKVPVGMKPAPVESRVTYRVTYSLAL